MDIESAARAAYSMWVQRMELLEPERRKRPRWDLLTSVQKDTWTLVVSAAFSAARGGANG